MTGILHGAYVDVRMLLYFTVQSRGLRLGVGAWIRVYLAAAWRYPAQLPTCCGKGNAVCGASAFSVHRVRSADPRACERDSVEGLLPGFFRIHELFHHGLWLDRNRKEGLWSFFGGAEGGLAPLSLTMSCAQSVIIASLTVVGCAAIPSSLRAHGV